MIRREGLRHRSYYLETEYDDSINESWDNLDDDEKIFVQSLWDQDDLINEIQFMEYKDIPVNMETFLLDPYYFGIVGKTLFPAWIDDLIELFTGEYHEAIITGALGTGKTTMAQVAIIRMLYEASCLKNPQVSYGIMDGSPIVFANIGVTKTNAERVVFDGIASKLHLSPYFMDQYRPINRSKKEIVFFDNIQISPGSSNEGGIIGMNIFGAIVDESNFFDKRKSSFNRHEIGRAQELYAAIQRRMKSRFMSHGKLPGILMIVSSKQTVNDFTEKRIKESYDNPHVFVRDYAQWETKARKHFSPRTFKVLIGNDRVRHRIISDIEEKQYAGVEDVHIIEVPEDFKSDFEHDINGAIRDIAGISTVAISNFIHQREKIFEMLNRSREHPFSVVAYDMSKEGSFRWDYLCLKIQDSEDPQKYEWRPYLSPQAVRHVHIDLALTQDSAGICMGHISHMTEVIRRRRDSNGTVSVYKEMAPYIVIDLILEIIPPKDGEIILSDVRQLVYDLSAHGYPIRFISLDNFQSADSIQQFRTKGYMSEVLSLDRTPEPHETMRAALYENRVDCYPYDKLTNELKFLEKNITTGKVDHNAQNSKDLADAFSGVIHSLTTKVIYPAPPPERGISEVPDRPDDVDHHWVIKGRHAKEDRYGNKVDLPLPFIKG